MLCGRKLDSYVQLYTIYANCKSDYGLLFILNVIHYMYIQEIAAWDMDKKIKP